MSKYLSRLVEEHKSSPDKVSRELKEAAAKKQLSVSDFHLPTAMSEFFGHRHFSQWLGEKSMPLKALYESTGTTSAAFQSIFDPFVQSSMMQRYEMQEFVFSKLIPTRPTVKRFEIHRKLSRIGDETAVVPEGRAFPVATMSPDWQTTPEVVKRGFMVEVTKEAIKFDETGQLMTEAQDLSAGMGANREKRACACLVDAGESVANGSYRYTWQNVAYATYQASTPWVNIRASNALAEPANVDAARLTYLAMTDPQTGEPLNATIKDVIVPPALAYRAAFALTNGTVGSNVGGFPTSGNPPFIETTNPINTLVGPLRLLGGNSQYFRNASGSDTTWYIGDIAEAFEYIEAMPFTVLTQGEESDSSFNADIAFRVRASEMGTFHTKQPRKILRCTA